METKPTAPSTIHNAPVSSVGDHSPQQIVNDRTGLFIAIFALALAAIALGVASMGPALNEARNETLRSENDALKNRVDELDREVRLQRLETDELRLAVKMAGINDHGPEDKP